MVTYEKINKTKARKLYNRGLTIHLLPCKVNPAVLEMKDSFIQSVPISLESFCCDFDKVLNEYEYYNCCDSSVGSKASHYVSTEELEKYMMCNLMCN